MVSSTDFPRFLIIAGPNGAGKSTVAAGYVPESMEFLNADEMAKELRARGKANVDILAGKRVLARIDELFDKRRDFCLETTLSGRFLVRRIQDLQNAGYRVHLAFVWLPNVEIAIERVAERVRRGGHDIPEHTIRRRYFAGLKYFQTIYRPLVDSWGVHYNATGKLPILVAEGAKNAEIIVYDHQVWKQIVETT